MEGEEEREGEAPSGGAGPSTGWGRTRTGPRGLCQEEDFYEEEQVGQGLSNEGEQGEEG